MAKRKRKDQTQEPATAGDAHETPAPATPAELAGPWDEAVTTPVREEQPAPVAGQSRESPRSQEANGRQSPPPAHSGPKPRGVLGHYLGGRRVELIDDGNERGIGIKLSFDDPAERPSEAVKQILKAGDEKRPGFTYHREREQWRKRIGRDADPRAAIAIRLDAERRVEAVVEQMTHEERLRAEREQVQAPNEKTPA